MNSPALPNLTTQARWKSGMRELVRQSQLSQQGLAALMAELIQSRLNEDLSKTSLVAGLSRFINGKGSEFPAWFIRESERLLPLALALGLSDTSPIWSVYRHAVDEQEEPENWHPAFPSCSVEVKAPMRNLTLDSFLTRWHRLKKRPDVLIVGPRGSGKNHLSRKLRAAEPSLETQVSTEAPLQTKDQVVIYLDYLNISQLHELCETLCSSDQLPTDWRARLNERRDLLVFAGQRTISEALWFLAVVARVPHLTPAGLCACEVELEWSFAKRSGAHTIAQSFWHRLCWLWWLRHLGDAVNATQLHQMVTDASSHSDLPEKQHLLELVRKARDESGKQQKQALSDLETALQLQNVPHIQNALEQGKLIFQDSQRFLPCRHSQLKRNAALFWLKNEQEFPREMLPGAQWWQLLDALIEAGLSINKVLEIWQDPPPHLQLDRARSIVCVCANQRNPTVPPLSAWALTLISEIYALQPLEDSTIVSDLRFLSRRFVGDFPKLSSINSLRRHLSDDVWYRVMSKSDIVFRELRALCPFQMMPNSLDEWRSWPQTLGGIEIWEILVERALHDDQRALRLLSIAPVDLSPLAVRLKYLGSVVAPNGDSFRATVADGWDSSPMDVIKMVQRIGLRQCISSLRPWLSPMLLAQSGARNLKIAISVLCGLELWEEVETAGRQVMRWLLEAHHQSVILRWRRQSIRLDETQWQNARQEATELLIWLCAKLCAVERFEVPHELCVASVSSDLQRSVVKILLVHRDTFLLDAWLEGDGRHDTSIRSALMQDIELLLLAWKGDKRGTRRDVILELAGLHQPAPHWLVQALRRHVFAHQEWPGWVSPYRPECADVLEDWLSDGQVDKPWSWMMILHKSRPFPLVLVDKLRQWIEGPNVLEGLVIDVNLSEAIRLLGALSSSQLWAQNGLVLLWSKLLDHPSYDRIAPLLIQQLLLTDAKAELFRKGWRELREPLSVMLCEVWLAESSADELLDALCIEHPDAMRAAERLLISRPEETVAFLSEAVQAGSVAALRMILKLPSQNWLGLESEILPLLTALTEREQRKLDRIPQIANFRKLQCWKQE